MKQNSTNAKLIAKLEAAEKRIVELERDLSQKNRTLSQYEQAEEAPAEAELRYRALFEQSHDAIFIVDLAGRHLAVNQRAVDMLEYSHKELLALSVNELSADPAQSQQILQRLRNGEHIPTYERLLHKKDGSIVPVEINVELVYDVHGKPLHIQSVVRDITDRRRAEIELQHRNDDVGLINAINEMIIQGGNLEAVINVLAKELKRIFASESCSLYLLSSDEQSLTMQQYILPTELARRIEKLIGSTIPLVQIPIKEGGYFHKVLHARRGTITSDPKEIQNWIAEYAETTFLPPAARNAIRKLIPQIYKLLNVKSTIVVPLLSNGKAIGLLAISSPGLFTSDDLARIENIGRQLTGAILRQQAVEKIQRSEEFLNSIQNALSASIAILDEEGTIVRVNSAWRKFGEQNGLSHPESCIGLNYLDICDSASGPNGEEAFVVAKSIREVITGQRKEASVEYPGHSPQEKRWFMLRITRFEDGDKIWVVLAHENITERKRAEEALRESEAVYRQAIEVAGAVPYYQSYYDNGESIKYEFIGEGIRQITGYEPKEFSAQLWDSLVEEINLVEELKGYSLEEGIQRVRSGKNPIWKCEYRIRDRGGKIHRVFEAAIELRDELGVSHGSIGTFQDITERKEAEEALRQSEQRYRALFEDMPIAIWEEDFSEVKKHLDFLKEQGVTDFRAYFESHPELVLECDRKIRVLDVNNAAVRMYRADGKDQLLKSMELGSSQAELDQVREFMVSVAEGKLSHTWEGLDRTMTGEQIEISLAATVSPGYEKDHSRIIVTTTDITQRKRAEEELRASEERFRQLADNIQEAFWMTDAISGEEIYANPATGKIWGRPLESLLHEPNVFIESVLPEDRPTVNQVLEIQKSGKNTEMEYRITRPDGAVRWIWDRAFPIFDDSGNVVRLTGVAADITERKQAEEALHESELKYRNLVETSHDLIWAIDGEGIITYLNQASKQIYGYEPEELIGHSSFEVMDPKYYHLALNEFKKSLAETDRDKFVDVETVVRHRDGRKIILSANSLVLRDDNNNVVGVVGTSRDITERKKAEEQLRKLSRAVEQSASTIVITNIQGQIEYVNPKFTETTGYTLEEALGQNPRILKSGHTQPEEYDSLWKTITSGKEWHGELLNKKKNGELYWESAVISPILNEHEEITHFIAVKEDITERKQNEAEISRHLAELEALYENGLAVGRLLEPHAIGERIIQTFSRYLSWHHVTIRLRKDESDELELIAFHLPQMEDGIIVNEEHRIKSGVSKVGQGISGWVVETGNTVRSSNLPEDPHYAKTYEGMQSGLYMPLKVGDRVIGVISVESEQSDAFSEQDERLVATLANQAATALENARLYQSAQKEIWDRKLAEDALRQSEEKYRRLARELEERVYERTAEVQDLYDNAPCGYLSLDQDGHIIRINQTELNWLGYTREEVIGHSLQDFVTDESRKTFKQTFPAFKQHGLLRDLELEMMRKDGSIFPTLVSATAVYDKDGKYQTSRSTLFDDTDRKHALETLRLANTEMKRAMRMKDEFLASMSHELRTPLNAILGLSESLLEQTPGPINEKQQKYLGTVNESGRHLLELINDILDLAKIESGQIKLDPGRVNINAVCETSLRMIKQLAQKKNQTVEVEVEKEIEYGWADERRLKQMIVNLLSNAVKFTPEGGQLGLKVHLDRKDVLLLITVWDRGIGIREEDLKRLFQPFVQLDSSLSRASTGTGLGLALVAEMARLHGGSVSVSSELGQGSQFNIILPWDPAVTADTLDKLKVSSKIPIIRRSAEDKKTILLVEDTDSVVLMLRDYLELSGYKVEIARNGLDGVSKSIALQPDLILMDVQMPGMDGLEATRRIRREASLKNTPIIALTALAMPSDRESCLKAGMNDYLSKPINLKELVKTMQRHLPDSETGKKL